MTTAADTVTRDADAALGQREQIRTLIDQAVASVTDVSDGFAADIAPQVDQLTAAVRDASSVLDQDTQRLDSTVSTLDGAAADADATVADIRTMLDDTAAHLREAGAGLTTFHDDLADALTSGDADAVRSLLAGDRVLAGLRIGRTGRTGPQGRVPDGEFRFGHGAVLHVHPVVDRVDPHRPGGQDLAGGRAAAAVPPAAAASGVPGTLRACSR